MLEKNYDTIKAWLPAKVNYVSGIVANLSQNTNSDRFIEIKLLGALYSVAKDVEKIEHNNLSMVAGLAEQLYNILEDYVAIQPSCSDSLKEKIRHFAYAVKQMKEYSQLFSSLIEYKFNSGSDLNSLSADLVFVIKNCRDVLAHNLREAVIDLAIDESSTDIAYHQEAISILGLQQGNVACVKKQAKCNNLIGYSKKQSGELSESIKYFVKALMLDRTIHDTYNEIGDIFESQGKYKEAIKFLTG